MGTIMIKKATMAATPSHPGHSPNLQALCLPPQGSNPAAGSVVPFAVLIE